MKTTNFTSKKKINNSNYFVRYFSQAFPEKYKKGVCEIFCRDVVLKISFSPVKLGSCFSCKGRLRTPL